MIGPDAHPGLVRRDVVDPVRARPAELGDGEVVHAHSLRVTLGTELPAAVAERPDELLLLGVDRDDRLAQRQLQLDRGVEMGKLGVAVGVLGALERLAVGLQAVALLVEELTDDPVAHPMASPPELNGQPPDALGRPAQG